MTSFPGVIKHYGNRWHGGAPPLRRWLDAVVIQPDGCLTWGLSLSSAGYGAITVDGVQTYAHRFAYTEFVGEIPGGYEIDHLCRNRACCNPAHLEAVTRRINQRRGEGPAGLNARKTHCINGHEFTPENTWLRESHGGGRQCRACNAARSRAHSARVLAEQCGNGHTRTPDNTYVRSNGLRMCLECLPHYGRLKLAALREAS